MALSTSECVQTMYFVTFRQFEPYAVEANCGGAWSATFDVAAQPKR